MADTNQIPDYTRMFPKVYASELGFVERRRDKFGLDAGKVSKEADRVLREVEEERKKPDYQDPETNRQAPRSAVRPDPDIGLVGLALSGGGIRSATFNLGLLQALARRNILRFCDYLSTVSGGGYIGSCLSSILRGSPDASVQWDAFPFRFQRDDKPDERKEVKHLRAHSNYLAPKGSFLGINNWRMVGTYLSSLIVNSFVPVSLVIIIASFIHRAATPPQRAETLGANLLWVSLIVFGLMGITKAAASIPNLKKKLRGIHGCIQAGLTMVAILSAALGGLVLLALHFSEVESAGAELAKKWLSGVSIASLLSLVSGFLGRNQKGTGKLFRVIFRFGWILAAPVVLAWLLHLAWTTPVFEIHCCSVLGRPIPWITLGALGLLLVSCFINTNRVSLHHFYRDRLSEAYIIKRATNPVTGLKSIDSNEPVELRELHEYDNGPYHLINSTLNIPSSRNRYARGRGADIFLFSRNYCGSESTGYRRSDHYEGGKTRLATAMAIAGAAASPQQGTSTNPALRFLMVLLNVRLNRWMPNPDRKSSSRLSRVFRLWPWYFIKELFGLGKETGRLLNLSDGGHSENLGLYSLIQRGCRYIIASDAGMDPNFAMGDLANVFRKVRIDLGVGIAMDMTGLRPDPKTRCTPLHYAAGKILYPKGKDGYLIYLKSSLRGDEPEDLLEYRRRNPSFPDQSTGDQFFDEAQFESYRKLGEWIGREVFPEEVQSVDQLFKSAYRDYENFVKSHKARQEKCKEILPKVCRERSDDNDSKTEEGSSTAEV